MPERLISSVSTWLGGASRRREPWAPSGAHRLDVTPNGGGENDERAVLERTIEADRLYVMDRGHAKFALDLEPMVQALFSPAAFGGGAFGGPFGEQFQGCVQRHAFGRHALGQRSVGLAVGDVGAVAAVQQLHVLAGDGRDLEGLERFFGGLARRPRPVLGWANNTRACSRLTSSGVRSSGSERVSSPHLTNGP